MRIDDGKLYAPGNSGFDTRWTSINWFGSSALLYSSSQSYLVNLSSSSSVRGETASLHTMRQYFSIIFLTSQSVISIPSPSPAPLEKFPHPYVAHPKPDHGPGHHDHPHHVAAVPEHPPPPPPPEPHGEEHKLPRKCHTEYVSVISKVIWLPFSWCPSMTDHYCRNATRSMRRNAPQIPSTNIKQSM